MSLEGLELQGGLLTGSFIDRLRQDDAPGTQAKDYDVPGRLEDRITTAWNELQNAWQLFAIQKARIGESEDEAYRVTRDHWIRYLFDTLRYGHLTEEKPIIIESKAYPIRFSYQGIPIQVVGFSQNLDKGPDGTARGNPHSQLQEYINRTQGTTWGILTNGHRWRILRDNAASTRVAYIEFDLETIMGSGEEESGRFDVFGLFWRVAHASRITGESPWLEKWMREADRQGIRALDGLRTGVTQAIEILGTGFLKHPRNRNLHQEIQSGTLSAKDYYHEILRLVYRLLFLFVTEDRDLLLAPDTSKHAREVYVQYYSTQRLRRMARKSRGSQHHDLFESLKVVMNGLKESEGCPSLGLPPLNSALWSEEFCRNLDGSHISNLHLLRAVRKLSRIKVEKSYRNVDYRSLGTEELGGVYESLLELSASVNPKDRRFTLTIAAGSERKSTGSYYTPHELVDLTLDEALEPMIQHALGADDPEEALLQLKVCDPTCGSGHFLIGAAKRIAKRLATHRSGEAEPVRQEVQHALRDVISNCIYGVDINPMAAELCKVSLWLEAMEPGKPLAFLEHRIKVGNAYFGATPNLMEAGIPDDAYTVHALDNPDTCHALKASNRKEREILSRHVRLAKFLEPSDRLVESMRELDSLPADSVADIGEKQRAYLDLLQSDEAERLKSASDAYCTAWTQVKNASNFSTGKRTAITTLFVTTSTVQTFLDDPESIPSSVRSLVESESNKAMNQFFHWNLAFPQVFSEERGLTNTETGWQGGFDVIVGNPPWDRVRMQDKEWFAARVPEIAATGNATKRRRKIQDLQELDPHLYNKYMENKHWAEATSHWALKSGANPTCGRGTINTAYILAERYMQLLRPKGRAGFIVPLGLISDHYTRAFFQKITDEHRLTAVLGFENEEFLFPGVAHNQKFCVLGVTGVGVKTESPILSFYARRALQALEPDRCFALRPEEIQAINPNSKTCPIFRSARDGTINGAVYANNPVLKPEGGQDLWDVSLLQLFHMSSDSELFKIDVELQGEGYKRIGMSWIKDSKEMWPAWEGKMIGMYDHHDADIIYVKENPTRPQQMKSIPESEKADPKRQPEPYQWGPAHEARSRLPDYWPYSWYPVIKRVSAATNERTFVGCVLPQGATSYTLYPLVSTTHGPKEMACLLANLLSSPADYLVRQKTTQPSLPKGVVHETAVIAPHRYGEPTPWDKYKKLREWILPRVLELSYTSHSLSDFAKDLGFTGEPFPWDPARRMHIMAELHACFFHLYGIKRADAEYIMDSFWAWRNREEKGYGDYKSKRLTLKAYDTMLQAMQKEEAFKSLLEPPPGYPAAHAGNEFRGSSRIVNIHD
jgi:hypothetical protein